VFEKGPSSRIVCSEKCGVKAPVSNGFSPRVWFFGSSIWGAVDRVCLGGECVEIPRRREPCLSVRSGRIYVSYCNLPTRWSFCKRKNVSGSSDDFSAMDFPLPTNLTGKSSVLPWQQEDCDNTNHPLWRGHVRRSCEHLLSQCEPALPDLRCDPRRLHPRFSRHRLSAVRRMNPWRPD